MAVAGVIETRAYFRRQKNVHRKFPLAQKHQKHQAPQPMDDDPPMIPTDKPDHPALLPTQDPSTPARNPGISSIARKALSAPWTGVADLHHGDDNLEDLDDLGDQTAPPIPTSDSIEPGSSDVDS